MRKQNYFAAYFRASALKQFLEFSVTVFAFSSARASSAREGVVVRKRGEEGLWARNSPNAARH